MIVKNNMNFAIPTFPYRRLPILLYHQISETNPEQHYGIHAVPPSTFESQMRYLYEHGFEVITLDDLLNLAFQKKDLKKSVIITFDDGYLDNYTNAFPILQKYGFSATVFLVTDFLGKEHAWPQCTQVPYMTWRYIKEMSKYKISFQSHTCSHQDLTCLENGIVMRELLRSRKIIEEKLGLPVKHLSYPYGFFDQRVKDLVKKVGYLSACAVSRAGKDMFEKERLMITLKDNHFLFVLKASGWAGWIRGLWHKVKKPEYRP